MLSTSVVYMSISLVLASIHLHSTIVLCLFLILIRSLLNHSKVIKGRLSILTEVSGIHKLSVSDLGEKLTIPIQLRRVRRTQATIVHSGCKATCKCKKYFNIFKKFPIQLSVCPQLTSILAVVNS